MARPGATLPGKAAAVWSAPRARRTYAVPASLEPLRYALVSALAVAVALAFLFPIYWSASNSLRDPLDTFTVTGLGFPWLNFQPDAQELDRAGDHARDRPRAREQHRHRPGQGNR
jgi:ABC-type glycerol-3-phosphate transport system permease component